MSTKATNQTRRPRTIPQQQAAAEPHHGQELARLRVSAGLTQEAAAKLLGMSAEALSKIESRAEQLPAYKRVGIVAILTSSNVEVTRVGA